MIHQPLDSASSQEQRSLSHCAAVLPQVHPVHNEVEIVKMKVHGGTNTMVFVCNTNVFMHTRPYYIHSGTIVL